MKAQITILLALMFLVAGTALGQKRLSKVTGKGELVRQELTLDAFHGIRLGFSGDIILKQGVQHVEIAAQENLIEYLSTDIKNGIWNVDFDRRIKPTKRITLYVTVPDLTEVSLAGSGSIRSDGSFHNLGDLEIRISGTGEIDFDLEAGNLKIQISGSGDAELTGNAATADFFISGSGEIDAGDLRVGKASVKISGSGDVEVFAVDTLDAKISGSGDIKYRGNPKVHAQVSGSGEVGGIE